MKINVAHHVYSSDGGYKTLKVSGAVPQATIESLEEWSRLTHKFARRSPRFSLIGFDEIYLGLSRLSLAGSDHAGRTRACVHNVLVRRDEIEHLTFFDIFSLPGNLFLPGQKDIGVEVQRLTESFNFKPADPVSRFPHAQVPQRQARNILRALLHDGTTILRAVEGKAIGVVRSLAALLPPITRESISVITGDYVQALDGRSHTTLFLVPPEFDAKSLTDAGITVLDDGGLSGTNLHKAHPFSRMILSLIYGSDEDRIKLSTLLRAINTYRPIVAYSLDGFKHLVAGFNIAHEFFSRDGHLHVEGAPEKGLEGAQSFFRAGHPDIVFDIFNSCLHLLGKRSNYEGLSNFENVVISGIDTLTNFFSEVPQDANVFDDIGDFDE